MAHICANRGIPVKTAYLLKPIISLHDVLENAYRERHYDIGNGTIFTIIMTIILFMIIVILMTGTIVR